MKSAGHLIIGGGPAALSAAKAIRRQGDAPVTMLCGEGILPYARPALSHFIGDGREPRPLEREKWFAGNGIEIIFSKAVSIDPAEKSVETESGGELSYQKLLIAAGANPFSPVCPGEGCIPVFTLRSLSDARRIFDAGAGAARAVVLGGGILGIEAALSLAGRGIRVSVCELADMLLPALGDRELALELGAFLETAGIAAETGKSVEGVSENGVLLSGGGEIPADFLLVSVGVRPETSLAKAAGAETSKGILTDSHMRTSLADVFAAGDCCEHGGRVCGLVATAMEQGSAAGRAMAGDFSREYVPAVPSVVFAGRGCPFTLTGSGAGCDERHPLPGGGALYFRGGVLCGGLARRAGAFRTLAAAIAADMDRDRAVALGPELFQ